MTERLYPLIPTPAVDAPEGHFEPEDDGGYDFPGELAARLHSARYGKRKLWETSIERQERTHGEDLARRRDPAASFDALERLALLGERLAGVQAGPVTQDAAAELAALRARIAELEGAPQDDGAEEGADAPAAGPAKAAAKRTPPARKAGTPAG